MFLISPRLVSENLATSYNDKSPSRLRVCPSYSYTDGVRTGCDLEANIEHDILISFKGMLNNTLVRNTFRKELIRNGMQQVDYKDWISIQSPTEETLCWNTLHFPI